jgi:hypothetical protein
MSWNEEQFGISKQELSEMKGRAIGGHIWDSMEEAMGGPGSFRQSFVTEAWSNAHANFQGEDVRSDSDDDDYPVFHHQSDTGLRFKYPIGGPYMDVYDGDSDTPFDTLHMGDDKEERLNPNYIKQRATAFEQDNPEPWWR